VDDAEVTELQQALLDHGWLAPDAVVVIERSTRTAVRGTPLTWVDGITADRSKRYGETTLWYGRRS
jgi:16S rRNA (guanine966-N2)-methyltransferase